MMKQILGSKALAYVLCFLAPTSSAFVSDVDDFESQSKIDTVTYIPFLTKQNTFIYVDKETLKRGFDQQFVDASLFTPTGFATVRNKSQESAIIDVKGNVILDYSNSYLDLTVVNGLTFYSKRAEYEKRMPFWNWEWNILGGPIKKEQTYHKVEIGVLETKQILLRKDVPYDEDNYYLDIVSVDKNHIFWQNTIYQTKKRRLRVVEKNVIGLLDDKRMIKGKGSNFEIYELGNKKAIYDKLQGTQKLSIKLGVESLSLDSINEERYIPEIPKLLVDGSTNHVYPYPQYEKKFPKEIRKATDEQISFIKRTSLVYSITNSPYFLLGVFNFDHDVWAFDWLYIDTNGDVSNSIGTYDFKILDQVGNLVWPDRKMILSDRFNDSGWKFGKIKSYKGMGNLYLIPVEDKNGVRTTGLWNAESMNWEIKPEYGEILVLDIEKEIYSLRKNNSDTYTLYDKKRRQYIGNNSYRSINSDGSVTVKDETDETIYYYIDIYTGREYKEN